MTLKRRSVNPSANTLSQTTIKASRKALTAFLIVFLLTACSGEGKGEKSGKGKSKEKPPAPVIVTAVSKKTIPVVIEGTGHVEAGVSVNVRPRVSGKLLSVHFKEGQEVKKGDLLFTVDPAPFRMKLEQARADLERDKAKLNLAKKQVKRYEILSDKGFLSTEEYEQLENDVAVLAATVRSDQAAVESAALDLSYCSVKADTDGVASSIAVDPGNLVTSGDSTPLTTLRRMKDLDVSFPIPEKHVREIRAALAHGKVTVRALSDGDSQTLAEGVLTFIDNSIDATTGTVILKARFKNDSNVLWPGQFVRVVLGLPVLEDGLSVPAQAVQTGQKGSYVYVIQKDNKAGYRDVVAGRTFEGDTLIVQGLSEGENVVVEGHLKLSPGAAVTVIEPGKGEPDKTPGSSRPVEKADKP